MHDISNGFQMARVAKIAIFHLCDTMAMCVYKLYIEVTLELTKSFVSALESRV